ncbi:hypothetical protein SCAR479_13886 [Seiridium cardinale]|uniref:Uncharacterized protein n=1 Tax=Seiridium cardinale TaxID=138064 RepID=A0ABR2X6M6_9PEZI
MQLNGANVNCRQRQRQHQHQHLQARKAGHVLATDLGLNDSTRTGSGTTIEVKVATNPTLGPLAPQPFAQKAIESRFVGSAMVSDRASSFPQ